MSSPKLEIIPNAKGSNRHPGIYKRGGRYVVRFRDRSGKQHKRAAGTLAE